MDKHGAESENRLSAFRTSSVDSFSIDELLELGRNLLIGARDYVAQVALVAPQQADPDRQLERHGFAWIATLCETLAAMQVWAEYLVGEDGFGRLEQLIFAASLAEHRDQLLHGIAMSQDEVIRPSHYSLDEYARDKLDSEVLRPINAFGISNLGQEIVSEAINRGGFGLAGLDETMTIIAEQFSKFVDKNVSPHAQQWHLQDELIPDELIARLSQLGVFGLTIPEEYGGSGMGKLAMVVVTEELSRGYIGVGSLGTRSEIAGELIQLGGTDAQKREFLPAIASGAIYPAAVFTEPDTGSDLASLKTRAVKTEDGWQLTGSKTWITHAARSDMMTVLARTDPSEPGHKGLTMFLLKKHRGTADNPFPDTGITGSEIEVLGYRGMKEYTLEFDAMAVSTDAALGESEGQGFYQLMSTFEGARIQTAARAVGVAVNACELAMSYATERQQFGKSLIHFQRVYGKIARMIMDINAARQLTYSAARSKDKGERCDIEAGMAKLLAARTAWSCADNSLQIHGGNGYATEFPISRVMCDARILNIFEGAAEIQAEIVARGLLMRRSNSIG